VLVDGCVPTADWPNIVQIKEKFGRLCVYAHWDPKYGLFGEVDALIRAAELRSSELCEKCGATGAKLRTGRPWIRTLCEQCNDVFKQEQLEATQQFTYICAACGEFMTTILRGVLDSGTVLRCVCGGETVVDLDTPQRREQRLKREQQDGKRASG